MDFIEHLHDEAGERLVRARDVQKGRIRMQGPHELKHPLHGRMQGGRTGKSREREGRERLAGFRQENLLEVRIRLREDDTLLQGAHVPADETGRIRGHVRERRAPAFVVNRRKGREDPVHRDLAHGGPLGADSRLECVRRAGKSVPSDRPARLVDDGAPSAVSVGESKAFVQPVSSSSQCRTLSPLRPYAQRIRRPSSAG